MTYTVHVFEPYAVMCERKPSGEPVRSVWVARSYSARIAEGFYPYIPSRAVRSDVDAALFEEWWAAAEGEAPAEMVRSVA